ncbi:hypothetical protein IFT43_15125 [Oxalobacteraceae sp. CFBP 13708]|nr:hypothetical protein [Oxalobacteraceae sp. CFBP 13708]
MILEFFLPSSFRYNCHLQKTMDTSRELSVPRDFFRSEDYFAPALKASSLLLRVSNDYETEIIQNESVPEVIAIQRLITLAKNGTELRVRWGMQIGSRVFAAPSLFPLLAVLLCLECSEHTIEDESGKVSIVDVQFFRRKIYNFRPLTDFFSDSQVVICADSRGQGRPKALYNADGTLLSRSDFETFVERLLAAQIGINVATAQAVKFSLSVSTIVAELFENTDIHGKSNLNGVPFRKNGVRGILFKRITLPSKSKKMTSHNIQRDDLSSVTALEQSSSTAVALEISVFDSGLGYYTSYSRNELEQETQLSDEWQVVHKCLERHYSDGILPDTRTGHTGMGLYEVLRALQYLKGKFEVRSGRVYGFRTFLEGDAQFQVELPTSSTRPGMPKPVLLDQKKQFVRVPSPNEMVVGAAIRVLIPLS